ncbi:hypothetical protein [Flagellimonas zhangzhouensis]|nr:hypothetical protein [Allomuricauda zhangzhouensis]
MKISFALILFSSMSEFVLGQEIVKNEVDEFTGSRVIESSWESLTKNSSLYSYVRFRKIDDEVFLNFKFMIGNKVFSVDKGEVLYLKFVDDEIVKLFNAEYQLSNFGDGAIGIVGSQMLGVELICLIDNTILLKLKEKNLDKIRVYTSKGYAETNIKSKQALKLNELARLLN